MGLVIWLNQPIRPLMQQVILLTIVLMKLLTRFLIVLNQ